VISGGSFDGDPEYIERALGQGSRILRPFRGVIVRRTD
jgi:hypothetical protein